MLVSVAAASDASDAVRGLGTTERIASKVLGEERELYVSIPAGCETGGTSRCPVLYVLDAEAHYSHTVTTATFLARNGRVPALIVVGIVSTDRRRDLTPTPGGHAFRGPVEPMVGAGGGERFLDFLEQELVPWVEGRCRTQPLRILAGHSLGGLLALHALATRPRLFHAYVAVAPSLLWNAGEPVRNLEKRILPLPAGLHVTVVPEGGAMGRAADELRQTLSARPGLRSEVQHVAREDHGSVVLSAHQAGLQFVFDGWHVPRDPETGRLPLRTLQDVQEHYAALSRRLVFEVSPPEVLVNAIGYQALEAKDGDEAVRILAFNAARHPDSPNAHDSLAEALEAVGRLTEALASCLAAVEQARAQADRDLSYYEKHLRELDAKLAR
jgi:predicted alpha/beta superfamily hydrolase